MKILVHSWLLAPVHSGEQRGQLRHIYGIEMGHGLRNLFTQRLAGIGDRKLLEFGYRSLPGHRARIKSLVVALLNAERLMLALSLEEDLDPAGHLGGEAAAQFVVGSHNNPAQQRLHILAPDALRR